jgi:acyl-homoserine lactone acylase PvdQ
MKLFVKRNRYKSFEKARIEIEDTADWAALQMALHYRIEDMKKKGWDKCEGEDEDLREMYERAVSLSRTLDPKNESAWKWK